MVGFGGSMNALTCDEWLANGDDGGDQSEFRASASPSPRAQIAIRCPHVERHPLGVALDVRILRTARPRALRPLSDVPALTARATAARSSTSMSRKRATVGRRRGGPGPGITTATVEGEHAGRARRSGRRDRKSPSQWEAAVKQQVAEERDLAFFQVQPRCRRRNARARIRQSHGTVRQVEREAVRKGLARRADHHGVIVGQADAALEPASRGSWSGTSSRMFCPNRNRTFVAKSVTDQGLAGGADRGRHSARRASSRAQGSARRRRTRRCHGCDRGGSGC